VPESTRVLVGRQTELDALDGVLSDLERGARRIVLIAGEQGIGPVARRLRDLLMPVALKRFASPERMRWLYDYHVDWERHVSATGVSPRGRRGPLRVEAP
jgi:hypothetical protein